MVFLSQSTVASASLTGVDRLADAGAVSARSCIPASHTLRPPTTTAMTAATMPAEIHELRWRRWACFITDGRGAPSRSVGGGRGGCSELLVSGGVGDAQIHQIGEFVVSDQDVLWPDVAVHNTALMGGVEGRGDLTYDCRRACGRQRPVAHQHLTQWSAVDPTHVHEQHAVDLAVVVDRQQCVARPTGRSNAPRAAAARGTSGPEKMPPETALMQQCGLCGCPRPRRPRPSRPGRSAASGDTAQTATQPARSAHHRPWPTPHKPTPTRLCQQTYS